MHSCMHVCMHACVTTSIRTGLKDPAASPAAASSESELLSESSLSESSHFLSAAAACRAGPQSRRVYARRDTAPSAADACFAALDN